MTADGALAAALAQADREFQEKMRPFVEAYNAAAVPAGKAYRETCAEAVRAHDESVREQHG